MRTLLIALLFVFVSACTNNEQLTEREFCFEYVEAACARSAFCVPGYDQEACTETLVGLLSCEKLDASYCAEGWSGWTPKAAETCIEQTHDLSCDIHDPVDSCDYALLCGGLKSPE